MYTRKTVYARSTKHQVHLGISHATFVLISAQVDIIFATLKNDTQDFRL